MRPASKDPPTCNALSATKLTAPDIFLSGCQHENISNMITERHNIACRLIIKALSKGALGACIVSIDAGNETRLLLQNLQLPDDVSSRHVPSWLFKRSLSKRDKQIDLQPPN